MRRFSPSRRPRSPLHPLREVGWISREPRLRAPATITGPRTEGWPADGSAVQWIGHVINRGADTIAGVPYTWSIDGAAMLPGDALRSQPPWRQAAKAQTMLLRVRTASARAYLFVPVWEFNRLYFRNAGAASELQLPVRMIPY